MNIGKARVRLAVIAFALMGPTVAVACNTNFEITLETFGEGVTVELRTGKPGSSRVLHTRRTSGGAVRFEKLCAGSYFLAIGNEETVSVTPVRQFEDDSIYKSRITVQRGSGNVGSQSRKSL
jgi:hypothetical protein